MNQDWFPATEDYYRHQMLLHPENIDLNRISCCEPPPHSDGYGHAFR